ncbi:MAG: hypothetical protein HUU21_35805 [Polyangiaceae bacterium]|nr:hypothetical protein [Polyangiaceae bacterium]NUQ78922.1 hypothetical protein [Polyangiaceae bacterium]
MASHHRRADVDSHARATVPSPGNTSDEAEHTPLPGSRIDELLERVAQPTLPAIERPSTAPPGPSSASLRTARVTRVLDNRVELRMRGTDQTMIAKIDEGVERDLLAHAAESGGTALVEMLSGQEPLVIGLVQTRLPSKVEIKAKDIVIDAEREVLIRAGRAALRIREDGDVELVGSRILTMSRGLFRIVGRVLRLN